MLFLLGQSKNRPPPGVVSGDWEPARCAANRECTNHSSAPSPPWPPPPPPGKNAGFCLSLKGRLELKAKGLPPAMLVGTQREGCGQLTNHSACRGGKFCKDGVYLGSKRHEALAPFDMKVF